MELGIKNHNNMLPLNAIALRKVAILLCSRPKLYMYVVRRKDKCEMEINAAINTVSKEKLAEISLPVSTKEELANLMPLLLKEILKWLHFHEQFLHLDLSRRTILKHICWDKNDMVTVDYRETAKALIRHEKFEIRYCYMLACVYCLESCVEDLWFKISRMTREDLLNSGMTQEYHFSNPVTFNDNKVIFVFWTAKFGGGLNKMYDILLNIGCLHSSVYQFIFESTAVLGYRAATEYFFEKLTSEEKSISLVKTARRVACLPSFDQGLDEYQKFSDVLCYLLSLMTEEQVMEVIQNHPCVTLMSFLDWPRQDAFLHFATRAFPYLSIADYSWLLCIMSRNISVRYNYSKVFREFFLISPRELKNHTLTHNAFFLREFIIFGEVATIKFIFKNLEVAEKLELAMSDEGLSICFNLIEQGQWDFVKLFFQELKLTKEQKERYYASFSSRNQISFANLLSKMGRWTWFLQLTNDSKCNKETVSTISIKEDEKELPKEDLVQRPPKKQKNA